MAKKLLTPEVQVLLRHSVTLGQGEDAKTYPPGATVSVSQELADEIVALGSGTLVLPADAPAVELLQTPLQAAVDPVAADPQLPLEEAK